MPHIILKNYPEKESSDVDINVPFGRSLDVIMCEFNLTHNPTINRLYNVYYQEIERYLWKIQVKENLILYYQ